MPLTQVTSHTGQAIAHAMVPATYTVRTVLAGDRSRLDGTGFSFRRD